MFIVCLVQRIAIAYLVVAVCEIWLKRGAGDVGFGGYALIKRYHHQMWAYYNFNQHFIITKLASWLDISNYYYFWHCVTRSALPAILQRFVGLALTVTYTTLLYGLYVPDWEYDITSPDSTMKNFLVMKL